MLVYVTKLHYNTAARIINTAYFKVVNVKIPCKGNSFVSSPNRPYQLWVPHNILVNGQWQLISSRKTGETCS